MLKTTTHFPEKIIDDLARLSNIVFQDRECAMISYTVPWPKISTIDFIRQAADAPRMYWASEKLDLTFAAYDVAATLTARGDNRFRTVNQKAEKLFKNLVLLNNDAPPEVGPRLFGGFSFQPDNISQPIWSAFPDARFILPRYQLSWFKKQTWLTINYSFGPEDNRTEIAWLIHEDIRKLRIATSFNNHQPATSEQTLKIDDLTDENKWRELITGATRRIQQGDLDKVVLARARRLDTPSPIDVIKVLERLTLHYPDCYRFLFEPVPGHAFYGATPEMLVKVDGSTLRTAALAGSIRRGETPAEDKALGQQLMTTPKEQHEHALVVEAIRENLEPIVKRLTIEQQPGLCRLSNIQHLQTLIEAELPETGQILPIVEALHPTPALGGRPRNVALPFINEAEPITRGWYGSPIGWVDYQGNGMFAVAIRSAVSVGNETLLYAGAGIVGDSVPEKEWQETQLKFRPLMEALGEVNR